MAYEQFENQPNTAGCILFHLEQMNVPPEILENLEFSKWGEISYEDRPFAYFDWEKGDIPSLRFTKEFRRYALL